MAKIIRVGYYAVAAATVLPAAGAAGILAAVSKLTGCHADDEADRELVARCRQADAEAA